MNILFVAGPGRSGTTAFANYLNQHPRVLICRERYKFVQNDITPEYFGLERLRNPVQEETNLPQDYLDKLLAQKETRDLRWIGDKTPSYVRNLGKLHKNNPGSRFVILYRPIEEVAESYEARSKNPNDAWLGGKNGFEIGVRDWNIAMKKTQQFVEGTRNPHVLVVSYHDFFSDSEACIPLVSRFLELDFGEEVKSSWQKMSSSFESKRRQKEPLDDEQARYIQENKDHEAEDWILDRIERQWEDPDLPLKSSGAPQAQQAKPEKAGPAAEQPRAPANQGQGQNLQQFKQQVTAMEQSLEKERQRSQYLEARIRGLEAQMKDIRGSAASRMAKRFRSLRSRLSGK